jgi:DNA primase
VRTLTENYVDFRTIKDRVSMKDVLEHYKIELRPVGQHTLRGRCPLPSHSSKESTQSFGVNLEKNIWSCQSSSCVEARDGRRKGGNILDFVSMMENCSIRDAALKLQDWFLVSRPPARQQEKNKTEIKDTPETLVAEKHSDEGEEVNKPLSFTLKGIDPTHPYLKDRGIGEETAKHFGVGFFPGRGLMQGRIVIPIHNEQGELVAYAGRSIDGTEPKYKFPAGFKKSDVLFNLHRVRLPGRDPVIVVEGFFDCIKLHQAGFPAVALMGSSLSEAQEKLLCPFFPHIVLFLDGDPAGREASGAIAARLVSKTFVRVINLPDGIQPDMLSSDEIKDLLSV